MGAQKVAFLNVRLPPTVRVSHHVVVLVVDGVIVVALVEGDVALAGVVYVYLLRT